MRKSCIGLFVVALVVLVARSLAYAAEPGATAEFLEHRAGGPALPAFALAVLALGTAAAAVVCWLAAVAVRERALIERHDAHRFEVGRTLLLAVALTTLACAAGGLLEAYLHWRAGLGWHGLHCLVGPVHRDLLPIETGLSFAAAGVIGAAVHVLGWMRRTFARLAAQVPPLVFVETLSLLGATELRAAPALATHSARAPPGLG